jgi:hypothetical protein
MQSLEAKPVGYGSAGGGDDDGDGGESLVPDQVPSGPRAAPARDQIIQLTPDRQGRHWVLDAMGSLVSRRVCKGVDADKVGLCQKLIKSKPLDPSEGSEGESSPPLDVLPSLQTSSQTQPELGEVGN